MELVILTTGLSGSDATLTQTLLSNIYWSWTVGGAVNYVLCSDPCLFWVPKTEERHFNCLDLFALKTFCA